MSESELIKDLIEQPAKVYIDKNDYQQGFIDGVNQMIKELSAERQTGEWEEERDERHGISRFTCSQCGNVIQDVEDRITFFTFNRYCGRCGSKNA